MVKPDVEKAKTYWRRTIGSFAFAIASLGTIIAVNLKPEVAPALIVSHPGEAMIVLSVASFAGAAAALYNLYQHNVHS